MSLWELSAPGYSLVSLLISLHSSTEGPVTFSEFGVIVLFRKISSCYCQGWPYLFVFVVWDESVFAQL